MKKLFAFTTGLLLFQSVGAMQGPQAGSLRIKNDVTNGKVEVIIQKAGEEPDFFTLDPGEPRDIHNALYLNLLNVVGYGMARSWISSQTFTLGYGRPENLAPKIKNEIRKSDTDEVTLVIKPGGQRVGSYLGSYGEGLLGQLAEKAAKEILSYKYEYLPYIEKTEEEVPSLIFAQFPQVQKAEKEGRKIAPHYFLGISAKAAPNVIKATYDARVKEWTAIKNNPQDPKHKFAVTALEFIYSAYNAMTQGGEAEKDFNRRVEDELEAPLIH